MNLITLMMVMSHVLRALAATVVLVAFGHIILLMWFFRWACQEDELLDAPSVN